MTTVPARPGETIFRTMDMSALAEIATGGMTIIGTPTFEVLGPIGVTQPVCSTPTIVNAGTAVKFNIVIPEVVAVFLIRVICAMSDNITILKGDGILSVNDN